MLENAPQEAKEALEKQLNRFKEQGTLTGTVRRSIPSGMQLETETSDVSLETEPVEEDLVESTEEVLEDQETTDTQDTEEEDYSQAFATDFKRVFGVEVDEAKALVDDLTAFRQEMALMKHWQVTPTEMNSRINQVKEYFGTLPENQRAEFDSVEGAIAIWDFLQKQNSSQPQSVKRRPRGTVSQPKPQTKTVVYKESDIRKMSREEYARNYQEITKAYLENRVVP